MSSAGLLTLLYSLFLIADGGQELVLANGQSLIALEVTREGDSYVARFESGRMELPASLVREVRAPAPRPQPVVEPAPPPVAPEPEQLQPVPAIAELRSVAVSIGESKLRVSVPRRFRRAQLSEPEIVTFITEDEQESIRLARAGSEDRSWQVSAAVLHHHRRTYKAYETLAQRYTLLAGRPAWLLTFRYQRGDVTWTECQGFVELPTAVLVISATSREATGRRAANLVQTLGSSLGGTGAEESS